MKCCICYRGETALSHLEYLHCRKNTRIKCENIGGLICDSEITLGKKHMNMEAYYDTRQ